MMDNEWLYKCLMCDGYNYKCKNYTPYHDDKENGELCVWYRVMQNDLEKIKRGEENLTFKGLEKILRGDKNGRSL